MPGGDTSGSRHCPDVDSTATLHADRHGHRRRTQHGPRDARALRRVRLPRHLPAPCWRPGSGSRSRRSCRSSPPASWSGTRTPPCSWYIMLPVVIVGVVIGDGVPVRHRPHLGHGACWTSGGCSGSVVTAGEAGRRSRRTSHDRGIMVLLGARLLPGIRTPIFIMAGVLRVPLGRFLLADAHLRHPGGEPAVLALVHAHRPGAGDLQQDQRVPPLVMVSVLVGGRRGAGPEVHPQPPGLDRRAAARAGHHLQAGRGGRPTRSRRRRWRWPTSPTSGATAARSPTPPGRPRTGAAPHARPRTN